MKAAEKLFADIDIKKTIKNCAFTRSTTHVYYPANELFKAGKDTDALSGDEDSDENNE